MTIREIFIDEDDNKGKAPTIIKWKNENIVRNHTMMPVIDKILRMVSALDVIKIGLVGEPASGKGTLAETMCHLIHTRAKEQGGLTWIPKRWGADEFMDIDNILKDLPTANYIMHFEDLSFLDDKKKLNTVKRAITKIRHLSEGDVRIILLYDYHYSLALDKYLRQSNIRIFLSMGSSERENLINLLGKKKMRRIDQFAKIWTSETSDGKAVFQLGHSGTFTYKYKNPFVVSLVWDGGGVRWMVFPRRQWIQEHCSICSEGLGKGKSEITMLADDFIRTGIDRFGPSFWKAWQINESMRGNDLWDMRTRNARHYISETMSSNNLDRQSITEKLVQERGVNIDERKSTPHNTLPLIGKYGYYREPCFGQILDKYQEIWRDVPATPIRTGHRGVGLDSKSTIDNRLNDEARSRLVQ